MGLILMQDVLDMNPATIHTNLDEHGNCISASIPLLLAQTIEKNKITKGETLLLCGTSAGFSIGAALLVY